MDFGALMFFTDYAITAVDLAQSLEQRGFESVWAPEHSHIPTSRKTSFPGGGELPKRYYDAIDPFVSLTAAAVATKKAESRHRCLSGAAARPDPDRKTGRLDRSSVERPLSIRGRRRLESRRNGKSRHSL